MAPSVLDVGGYRRKIQNHSAKGFKKGKGVHLTTSTQWWTDASGSKKEKNP